MYSDTRSEAAWVGPSAHLLLLLISSMRSDEISLFRGPQPTTCPGAFDAPSIVHAPSARHTPLSHDAVLSAAATAPWARGHQGSDRERDAGDRRVGSRLPAANPGREGLLSVGDGRHP
eukprot:6162073-Prymnesium_polylepis.1